MFEVQIDGSSQRTRCAVYASLLFHIGVILAILSADMMIPLALQPLQAVHASGVEPLWIAPPAPAPPQRSSLAASGRRTAANAVRKAATPQPTRIPREIAALAALSPLEAQQVGGPAFSALPMSDGGAIDFTEMDHVSPPPPPPPPPPPAPELEKPETVEAPPPPIRIGGRVEPARIVKQVPPIYPVSAQRAGVQGAVIIEAMIDESGRLEDITVVSGDPMLIEAALQSVKQWRYEPTKLNGVVTRSPVNIRVVFRLVNKR